MTKFLKYSLAGGLVIALCWGAAIGFWRYRQTTPSNLELGLCLFAFPALLLAGLFFWAKRANKKDTDPPQASSDTRALQASAKPHDAAVQELLLLAWNQSNRLGDSTSDVLAKLADPPGLDLDKTLKDDGGFPILTGRMTDIDADALRLPLMQHEAERAAQLDDSILRAIAILERTITPVLLQAHAIAQQSQQTQWTEHLDAICIAPAGWPADAVDYLHAKLTRWANDAGLPAITIHPASESGPLALRSRFPVPPAGNPPQTDISGLTLILACDSSLSRQALDSLSDQGLLYSTRNPNGLLPSEGAAALLVMHGQQADLQACLRQTPQLFSASVRLWLPATTWKDTAHHETASATALMPHLLDAAGIAASEVNYMAIHAGPGKPTLSHALETQRQLFSDLDTETGLVLTAPALGSQGCAALWGHATLAAEKTRQSGQAGCVYIADTRGHQTGLVTPLPVGAPA